MAIADLHAHTTASDGTFTPRELVERAHQNGLAALAVTDHDTMGGLPEAQAAGAEFGVEIVPGIELSTVFEGKEVHVLGYYYDPTHPALVELTTQMREDRVNRMEKMVVKLQEAGIDITREEIQAEAAGAIGRPHFARVLMKKGYVSTMPEAFEKYLGYGKPGYVSRMKVTPVQAVEVVLAAGGVPVVAHPGLIGKDYLFDELVPHGLIGLEASHPDHDEEKRQHYKTLAAHHGLLATGGSDFHGGGAEHRGELGSVNVPLDVVRQLQAKSAYFQSQNNNAKG
ncbi:PHP domain-containing protein [Tumebacillus sp. ITR2]|uniref:PHP domain-containing protein n=1 Tax=Tumebacillus amylolyticus TaxID=2801339 RepID=A0ABS1JDW1_9BACL|nr:PHP domain-containing protein [Tumebacillus amylolyticus]MBL0388478.1 PHP domain-containing protein [Tumebacillus amylolyticus]